MHVVYPSVICFQSIHIVHITISYLLLLIFAIMTYLVTVMNFENRFTKDPTSKMTSRTDLFVLLSKTAYVFFFNFFTQPEYVLFKSIVLVVFSCLTFISYVKSRPYFNQTTQLLVEIFSGVYAWTNLVLLFTQIISGAKFTGSLQILFLGLPIICILIYTKQEDRLKLLMTPENQIESGELCQLKNSYYLYIVESKEADRQSMIILKGYINHHVQVCPYDTCPIKAYLKVIARDKLSSETERKKKSQGGNKMQIIQSENNQLLLAQGKALYLNGIRKYPKFVTLRIEYASFLQSRMRDRKGALNELSIAEKSKPSID